MSQQVAGSLPASDVLARAYDGALLDLDGTVFEGARLLPGVGSVLESARAAGMRVAYVTNNASRGPSEVAAHLTAIGLPAQPTEVTTSGEAAALLLADAIPRGSAVLVVGGPALAESARRAGLEPVDSAAADPVAVLQGWHPDLTWRQLAEGAGALHAGAFWAATNLDLTLPTERGLAPGNGSFVRALTAATGRTPDVVAGKPGPLLLTQAAGSTPAMARPLVVGDRLDTDIAGAVAAGFDSLLVLTGVSGLDELLQAPPEQQPTYVAVDLAALLAPCPPIERVSGRARVGRVELGYTDDGVELLDAPESPSARDADAMLRGACALAWERDGVSAGPRLRAAVSAHRPAVA